MVSSRLQEPFYLDLNLPWTTPAVYVLGVSGTQDPNLLQDGEQRQLKPSGQSYSLVLAEGSSGLCLNPMALAKTLNFSLKQRKPGNAAAN